MIFLYCASSKKNVPQEKISTENDWRPPSRGETPLSPGTVKVKAGITSIDEHKQNIVVRIERVIGYGPATPILPVGSEIQIELSSSLQEKLKSSKEFSLIQGDTATITMKHDQHLTSDVTSSQWRIIQIHE